jgi:hypothetical protein
MSQIPGTVTVNYTKCRKCHHEYIKTTATVTDIKQYYVDGCYEYFTDSDIEKDKKLLEMIDTRNFFYKTVEEITDIFVNNGCIHEPLFNYNIFRIMSGEGGIL